MTRPATPGSGLVVHAVAFEAAGLRAVAFVSFELPGSPALPHTPQDGSLWILAAAGLDLSPIGISAGPFRFYSLSRDPDLPGVYIRWLAPLATIGEPDPATEDGIRWPIHLDVDTRVGSPSFGYALVWDYLPSPLPLEAP